MLSFTGTNTQTRQTKEEQQIQQLSDEEKKILPGVSPKV